MQYEVLTRAMASIINLNVKFISEGDIEKMNFKDLIYNKVQPEILQPLLLQQWVVIRRDAAYQIIQDYKKQCELEKYRLYDIGADQLDKAVKACIKKQKDNYKIMENHYQKEIKDLKSALKLAMNELEAKAEQILRIEVEKNNFIVKFEALKKKYEVTEIEYEDIQQKLQFLNERAGKRQIHYNKEYEAQVSNLQHQVKNQKLDYRELDMLYRNQQLSFKQQIDDKDNIIKRLKQAIQLLQRQRNEINVKDKVQDEQLQEVYEFCKNNEQEIQNSSKENEDAEISSKMFRSYFQPSTNKNLQAPQKKIERNSPQMKQTISEKSDTSVNSQSQIPQKQKQDDEQTTDEIEEEQRFYAVSGDFSSRSQAKEIMESSPQYLKNKPENETDLSSNDQLSQSVLQMYKSSYNDPVILQQAINMQNQPSYQSQSSENNKVESEKLFISNLDNPNYEAKIQPQNKLNNKLNYLKQPFYSSSVNHSPSQNQLNSKSSHQYHSPQQHHSSSQHNPHKQQSQNNQFRQHQTLNHSQSFTKSASPYPHAQSSPQQGNSQKVIQSSDTLQSSSNNIINNQSNQPSQKINNLFGSNYQIRSTNQRAMTQIELPQNNNNNNYDVAINGESNEKQQNHRRPLSNQFEIQKDTQQN